MPFNNFEEDVNKLTSGAAPTNGYDEDAGIGDVDEWPDDADDGECGGRDGVDDNEPTLEVVTEEGRHDVRRALGETEQREGPRTAGRVDPLQLHVVRLNSTEHD